MASTRRPLLALAGLLAAFGLAFVIGNATSTGDDSSTASGLEQVDLTGRSVAVPSIAVTRELPSLRQAPQPAATGGSVASGGSTGTGTATGIGSTSSRRPRAPAVPRARGGSPSTGGSEHRWFPEWVHRQPSPAAARVASSSTWDPWRSRKGPPSPGTG